MRTKLSSDKFEQASVVSADSFTCVLATNTAFNSPRYCIITFTRILIKSNIAVDCCVARPRGCSRQHALKQLSWINPIKSLALLHHLTGTSAPKRTLSPRHSGSLVLSSEHLHDASAVTCDRGVFIRMRYSSVRARRTAAIVKGNAWCTANWMWIRIVSVLAQFIYETSNWLVFLCYVIL